MKKNKPGRPFGTIKGRMKPGVSVKLAAELRDRLTSEAENVGATLSGHIRMILVERDRLQRSLYTRIAEIAAIEN